LVIEFSGIGGYLAALPGDRVQRHLASAQTMVWTRP